MVGPCGEGTGGPIGIRSSSSMAPPSHRNNADMLAYLIALALGILLAHRLGAFAPWEAHRAALAFDDRVLALAEDVEWEERMQRAHRRYHRRRRPVVSVH